MTNLEAAGQLSTGIPYTFRAFDVDSINLSGMPEQKQEDGRKKKKKKKRKNSYRSLLIAALVNKPICRRLWAELGHRGCLCAERGLGLVLST